MSNSGSANDAPDNHDDLSLQSFFYNLPAWDLPTGTEFGDALNSSDFGRHTKYLQNHPPAVTSELFHHAINENILDSWLERVENGPGDLRHHRAPTSSHEPETYKRITHI